MADLNFPMDAFLQANQQKIANEQVTNPPIGTLLAEGLVKGVTTIADQKRKERENIKAFMLEAVKNETKDKDFVDISGKPYDSGVKLQAIQEYAKGNYNLRKNPETGNIELATKKGEKVGYFKSREDNKIVTVSITPENIDMMKTGLPGYNIQLGANVNVPATTYNKMFAPGKGTATPQEQYFFQTDKDGNLQFFGPDKQPVDSLPAGIKPIKLDSARMTESSESKRLSSIKPKKTEELYTTIEDYNNVRDNFAKAHEALDRISSGLYGKVQNLTLKNIDPNNPLNADWQLIKSILTDQQLTKTAQTKGAISDREMALFADAVGNDSVISAPRVKAALELAFTKMKANETALLNSYKRQFGEDPTTWTDLQSNLSDWEGKLYKKKKVTPQSGGRFQILEVK